MKTISLVFSRNVQNGVDGFNNPTYTKEDITVDGCLIAPITEPSNQREAEALAQQRLQVRIHLPKSFKGDISNSTVEWGGHKFKIDSDSVAFMDENCPTNWDRYFRGEAFYE